MLIQRIVKHLWRGRNREFRKVEREYRDKSLQCLFDDAEEILKKIVSDSGIYDDVLLYQFIDKGCDHCNNDGVFGGCSFCDFISTFEMRAVYLLTLIYRVDKSRYNQLILDAMSRSLHTVATPPSVQFISGSNTLSEAELPREFFKRLRETQGRLHQAAVTGFDTRANTVTRDAITKMKQCFSGVLGVNLGVEVADEWLRNHWLNKRTSNTEIEQAVALLKEEGCYVSLSVLLGIPGLSEAQSLDLFLDTVAYCLELGVDRVMCTPLTYQEHTLQAYLGKNLSQDPELIERGVMTYKGLFSIEGLLHAFLLVAQRWPEDNGRIAINPILFKSYVDQLMQTIPIPGQARQIDEVIKYFGYCLKRNRYNVQGKVETMRRQPFYLAYLDKLDGFDNRVQMKQTLTLSARKICDSMGFQDIESAMNRFADELDQWPLHSEMGGRQ